MQKLIHSPASRKLTQILIDYRKQSGMTQEEFATQLGWHRQTVSAVERGERMLLILEVFDYLRPFNISPLSFIERLEAELATLDNVDAKSTQQ